MRQSKMFLKALGVKGAVLEDLHWELGRQQSEEELGVYNQVLIVKLRPIRNERGRCPHCGRHCPGYDRGSGPRRWRTLDLGLSQVFLEAEAPRVCCEHHGVVVQRVPWARPGSGFTLDFEDQCAWLCVRTDKTTLSTLLRITWRSVGMILQRVAATARRERDLLAGLVRIGIDEISYKKGARYLIVVVDHDTGRLVWAAPGRDEASLCVFFDLLGKQRCERLRLVSADAASWIAAAVRKRCPQAELCLDPFHIVKWGTEALDAVRREVQNELKRSGQPQRAKLLKKSRLALWKNPQDLTGPQQATLRGIERDNQPLFQGYLLKEQLRLVFAHKGQEAVTLLDTFIALASQSDLQPFVKLAKQVQSHREGIEAALRHGLSNARVESANTKLRLLTRLAYGFHSAAPLIALAMLKLGGLCPPLPGRL